MTRRRRLLLAGLGLAAGAHLEAAAAPLVVTIPKLHPSSREHAAYFPRLLELALQETAATDGPFEIRSFDEEMSSPRQITELKTRGAINVMWDGTSREREAELRAVKVSLLRELNDYRVFLIRKGDQPRFDTVRSLADLRRLKAGAGVNWPSTDVLRANGLPVEAAIAYESLFPMLGAGRFDYLPRGVYEAWYEQREHAAAGLAIERRLFLHYHVPFHFFVHRDDVALAERIERGLQMAQRDGSFDRLFNSFESFRRSLAEINAGRRRVIELKLP